MKRRILIVEDDPQARSILIIALGTLAEADVSSVESAEQALALLETSPADVVVTDVRMGAMTGLELLAEIRQRQLARAVVVISGETDAGVEQSARQGGASGYFSKPFSAAMVRNFVSSLLEPAS